MSEVHPLFLNIWTSDQEITDRALFTFLEVLSANIFGAVIFIHARKLQGLITIVL